jgi:general secretion pathway protein G
LLAAIAVPRFMRTIQRGKEAVLRDDLVTMRRAIENYTSDKEKAPQGLDDLVTAGYLQTIPKDPMTGRDDTWMTDMTDMMTDINETEAGMDDVHSGAQSLAMDGTSYNTW